MSNFFATEESLGSLCHKVVDVRTQPCYVSKNILSKDMKAIADVGPRQSIPNSIRGLFRWV